MKKVTINGGTKEYTTFKDLHATWMKNSSFRKAREELSLESALIRAIIDNRIKKGVTQKALAEKIGTKQSSIARFESGSYNPTLSFVQKLAKALDVKIQVL